MKLKDAPETAQLGSKPINISNKGTSLLYLPDKNIFQIKTGENEPVYEINGLGNNSVILKAEKINNNSLQFDLFNPEGKNLTASIVVSNNGNIVFSIKGEGRLNNFFEFPGCFQSQKGQSWVVPINEGLLMPADDPYFNTWELQLYSGHGLCMPFLGLTDGDKGIIIIAETPDDGKAKFKSPRGETTSSWSFEWQASKGEWEYERRLRIEIIKKDGYVGIAKAYRRYVKDKGLLVTLKEKLKTVPTVDRLIGAVNIWWWKKAEWWSHDLNCSEVGKMLKKSGINKVLWSNKANPEAIKGLNELGFLSSRYDCQKDVWAPDVPIGWGNRQGWPDDLTLLPNGDWMKGWVARHNGKEYPGGVICSIRSLARMEKVIPEELATHPYNTRFIDTTTACALIECYHPEHPISRSQDREYKSKMFSYLSEDLKLVTGSETGMDWAVPFLHYFEGMMSLGPYRLPYSGYDLTSYKKPHDEFMRFQVGPFYRIPLFELVYHDCVVSYWYWGDSSNRIPEVWDERDLFNALYGTPPLWIVDPARWQTDKERFIKCYNTATGIARNTGYSEMITHKFINNDHTVQYSAFSNGTEVWVNFGDKPYKLRNGKLLDPKSYKSKICK